MKSYNNYLGIDIGKNSFVAAIHGSKTTKSYDNTALGITDFIKEKKRNIENRTVCA
ncbi:MAG: transposase [Gammaproteobacteria bacterium]|nr:transposase [Gammaproteobacteria bacterium]